MFCTTECWDFNDKSCEHYIDKTDLYFKYKNLKNNISNSLTILKSTNVDMPSTLLIETIDYVIDILQKELN